MAASQRRMNGSWLRWALPTALCALMSLNGVCSQDDAITDIAGGAPFVITESPDLLDALGRGDNDLFTAVDDQATTGTTDQGANDGSDAAGAPDGSNPVTNDDASEGAVTPDPQFTVDIQTIFDAGTPAGPGEAATKGTAEDQLQDGVQCVDKDELKDKDVVRLQLQTASNCEETKAKIKAQLGDLCGENCDIKIFQEENSSEVIISGDNVEADTKGMAGKFSSPGVKEKLGVVEAAPKWGNHPRTVLVSLLLTGLLLAALLIGGYCLRNHHSQPAKAKLAEESFPVDQENQGNTLVSVAPLHPQEPQEKPSANGESPEGVKTEAPPTNGHSTAKSPVADTEL